MHTEITKSYVDPLGKWDGMKVISNNLSAIIALWRGMNSGEQRTGIVGQALKSCSADGKGDPVVAEQLLKLLRQAAPRACNVFRPAVFVHAASSGT